MTTQIEVTHTHVFDDYGGCLCGYILPVDTLSLPNGPSAEVPEGAGVKADGSQGVAVLSDIDVALMMRQIRDAKSRLAEEYATCAALTAKLTEELAMIQRHWDEIQRPDQERIAYFEAQLTAHLLNKRAADPNCKSVKTPWGDILSEAQQPEFKRDDAVLVEWAKTVALLYKMPQLMRYPPAPPGAPAWEAIKKYCHVDGERLVTPEGEVVPGVTVVEKPLRVTVKVIE